MSNRVQSYNPKAHSPAIYIPCWLIQVPASELSHLAKLLYGRLAQWSSSKGIVHRSCNQLAQEIGVQTRVIERGLKELREVKLIDTYQRKDGGINHFRFLKHEWMSRPINENLEYSASVDNSKNGSTPPDKNVGTPPTKMSVPPDKNVGAKIRKIKRNKKRAIATPVDNSKTEKSASRSSPFLNTFPENFFPEGSYRELLTQTANKTNQTEHELLVKFEKVSRKYKTKSADWNKTFEDFLLRELPKRVYENNVGQKVRYDQNIDAGLA